MSEIDANIIVEGQKTVATISQDGEIVKDGGEIDATCIVEDSNGKRHKAVKIVNIDEELAEKSEIDAQVSNNNNELIMVTEEQDGEIIPENNSEIDFHCLVQKDDGKQLSIKTVELDGEIIKTGGAIDATCLVQGSDGKRYKAVKVFNLGGTSDWKNKPSDWSDIRKDCPENSIALYAGELGSNYIIKDGRLTWANPNIYLQSTDNGDTYINSGLKSQTFSKIECDFQRVSDGISCFFGGRQKAENNETDWRYMTDLYRYKFVNGSTTYYAYKSSDFNKHKMVYENGSVFLDGTEILSNIQQTSFNGTQNIYLFANNDNGAVQTLAKKACKLYNVKFYVNGTLVRHFVPVPSGLVIGDFTCPSDGMFDIVEQQFYANASTGTFTYGKDSVTNDYDNLGFTATCIGGYKVFIDGTQYGTTYASGSTCSITWSTSGITTGDIVTTPSLLKAHKIWIEPATEGNNITVFRCARVAASGREAQGILWAHFNIDNQLSSMPAFGDETIKFRNTLLTSITAKNNKLRVSNLYYAFYYCTSLEYTPEFILPSSFSYYLSGAFAQTSISKITLKDTSLTATRQSFQNCQNLKKITLKNVDLSGLTRADNFITNAKSLEDTILDVSNATGLTVIGCYGTSTYFMTGFKGLRVSNQAPFSGSAPQINVSYTGMDRSALVQLFNDLPTVTGGQIINVTGCTGTADLTAEDKDIALNKNWALILS